MSVVKLNMFLILKLAFDSFWRDTLQSLLFLYEIYSRYRTEYATMQLDKLI